ncbi:hypothetical protein [Isoptericola sp. AK164]|uniref:hypothetical protein n=1 Tax=Isoptericola sp. AK164 TaxID=3024246 RepID=UPI0024187C5D|nr:hypothetical protein [Isoptericola sp. AK164]
MRAVLPKGSITIVKKLLASVATTTLALGGLLVATATPASAHTPDIDATCDSLAVDLRYYSGAQVTVTVDDETRDDSTFTSSYAATFTLDDSVAHTWHVDVDAHDDDQWDREWSGLTEPCTTDVEPADELVTGLYLYEKVHPDQPAAWHNSGPQELIVQRDGHSFWDADDFPVEELPQEVCGTGWGVQQDVADVTDGFEIPLEIVWPEGGFDGHLVDWRHDDLTDLVEVPACDAPEPVTLPAPTPVEECDAEARVDLPSSELADYSTTWSDDRSEAVVTATPAEGVVLADGAQTSWTFAFTGAECDVEPVLVVPEPPTVVDVCGTDNDDLVVPQDSEQVTYSSTHEGVVATAAEGAVFGDLPDGYTAVDDTTARYPVDGTFTDTSCELVPGDVAAVCEGEVPFLAYEVNLPEGVEADGETPLTVTFLHPGDGDDVVLTDQPLAGRVVWPGASTTEPLQWPGWELQEDGTYVETEGNYAWTRDGVRVLFEVNPDHSTVVEYPAASDTCANPPSDDGTEVPAETVAESTPEAELPRTGATVGVVAGVAALLVAAGVSLFVARRRLHRG